jgi:outer membrane protein assembly factor BamB
LIWWLFFSRARWVDKLSALGLIIVSLIVTFVFIDKSIATAMMGLMFSVYAVPVMSLAFVLWALISYRLFKLNPVPRRIFMVLVIVVTSGSWLLLRTDGMDGSARHYLTWRWAPTPEERLLARADANKKDFTQVKKIISEQSLWPGFRGPKRNSVIRNLKLQTDWQKKPPQQIWRRRVGPGCSSFAVHGNVFYTQEQRGKYELVTCYSLATGQMVWQHRDKARFWDSHAGAGPRSTPTLADGRVYTLGGTGILNALDAKSGQLIWSRQAAQDAKVKALTWGFASSPLVVGDTVIVALAGKLAAYDKAKGKPQWYGLNGGNSYSSPHLVTLAGVPQVLHMSKSGCLSVDPASGKQLWQYAWPVADRILQPGLLPGKGALVLVGETKGLRCVNVAKKAGKWAVKEQWSSAEMLLNFNDFVVHKGHAYGFHGPSIACVDLKNGKRKWRGKPYRGWILLLADQDLLVVLSEKGKLALVNASPQKFTQLATLSVLTGKTWNHPVLVENVLLIRNAKEMAAYRLKTTGEII